MYKNQTFFPVVKFSSLIIALLLQVNLSADVTIVVMSALGIACLFVIEMIWMSFKKDLILINFIDTLIIIGTLVLGKECFFILIIVLISQIIINLIQTRIYYFVFGTICLLLIFILRPNVYIISFMFFFYVIFVFIDFIIDKYLTVSRLYENEKLLNYNLNKKLNNNNELIKTMRYTTALEERNRLATRIHDKIGHGISGSIIMLEAAMLTMDTDKEKAISGINCAIENLRSGVDDIRYALRDEKPTKSSIGISEIKLILGEFSQKYNKKTTFEYEGDLEKINLDIWNCIDENLAEILTNTLKHSNAEEFKLKIQVLNRIIKVEYKDNGTQAFKIKKGLGIQGIEERTAKCNGRCFITKENGFKIINIFDI